MQVQKINNSVYPSQKVETPAFRAKTMPPEIVEAIKKNTPKWAKFLSYAGEHQGEALNILVTAFGTAIICPMFIRFNPFSKEDKDTKAYSAWRQPISAIIAVVTQLTITKWFNDYLAKMASTSDKKGKPHYERADLRACPHERHLENIIKREHPEWDSKQVQKEIAKRQLDAEKDAIRDARKTMADRHFETKELLCQDYLDNAKSEIFKELKEKHKQEIENKFGKPIDKIRSIPLNKFLDKKLAQEAAESGVDSLTVITARAEQMMEKEINAEAAIKYAIEKLRIKHPNIVNAIQNCTEADVATFIEREGLRDYIGEEFKLSEIVEEIINKLNVIKDYEYENGKPEWSTKKFLGNTFDEIRQNIKIKKFIKSQISDAKRVYKTMNTQLGLLVTLATLPFSCGLLNWAYPRIMEKIMPQMSAKKKEDETKVDKEGGNK